MSDAARMFDLWADAGRAGTMAQGHWPMASQILERMHLKPGMNCLDVGCGNGYMVRAMASQVMPGGTVMGVDISSHMVQEALANPDNPPQVCYQVSPAEQLPFEDAHLDRVLSIEAIYYMPSPLTALKEWHRVLKPGGSVWIMVDYYQENPYCADWGDLIEIPMHFYSEREYRELLSDVGFQDVQSARLYNQTPLDDETRAKFKPGWGYNALDDVVDFRTRVGSLLLTGQK